MKWGKSMKPLGNCRESDLIHAQWTINEVVGTGRSHMVKTFLATVKKIDFVLIA